MKLEWMDEYRDVVEQLIKYANRYAAVYTKEWCMGTEIPISYAQIQVIEYLLENEELNQNMSEIAGRLGISNSAFSKLVVKLEAKGLLEKFHTSINKKDVIVRVTDYGHGIYQQYVAYIYSWHFSKMFEAGKRIPREYLPDVANFLGAGLTMIPERPKKPKAELIPLTAKHRNDS